MTTTPLELCNVCKRWYTLPAAGHAVRCTVLHTAGVCCHHGETEVDRPRATPLEAAIAVLHVIADGQQDTAGLSHDEAALIAAQLEILGERANLRPRDVDALNDAFAHVIAERHARAELPLRMRIPCPSCKELHIDVGEYATKVHSTHACQFCGLVWKPANVPTVGVRFLPGCENAAVKA